MINDINVIERRNNSKKKEFIFLDYQKVLELQFLWPNLEGIFIWQITNPLFLKRKSQRNFSLEDKKRLYSEWQASGLSQLNFCKKKGLVLSVFSEWCRKLSFSKNTKKDLSLEKDWSSLIAKIFLRALSQYWLKSNYPMESYLPVLLGYLSFRSLLKDFPVMR